MPNPIDENPASQVCILVEFSYESGPTTFVRYAAWEEDVPYGGNTFTAAPKMEVSLPKQDGTVKSTEVEIKMEDIAPISSMRSTFPPVTVQVWEIDPSDETTAYKLYRGTISNVEFNYNGHSDAVRVRVGGPKKRLETTISLKLSRFCGNTLGQRPCDYDRETNKETKTISAIDGNKVTLSAALSINDATHWKFGGIRYRGFEVSIHHFESTTTLYTTKPIPSHWLSQPVDILPGCDKTVDRCTVLGQTAKFTGMGLKIPNRDVRITEQ